VIYEFRPWWFIRLAPVRSPRRFHGRGQTTYELGVGIVVCYRCTPALRSPAVPQRYAYIYLIDPSRSLRCYVCIFYVRIVYILHFNQYLSGETYSRKYEELPNIAVHACKNITENVFVEKVWPANSALLIYVSTHCVETVKYM